MRHALSHPMRSVFGAPATAGYSVISRRQFFSTKGKFERGRSARKRSVLSDQYSRLPHLCRVGLDQKHNGFRIREVLIEQLDIVGRQTFGLARVAPEEAYRFQCPLRRLPQMFQRLFE